MAKGDFVFAGPDSTSYNSDDLKVGKGEPGQMIAGVTLLFLFVTIKLERKRGAVQSPAGNEPGGLERAKCVCKATIEDYALQANIYVDKDVPAGLRRTGVTIHEYYHLKHHKALWDAHKKELDDVLAKPEYPCGDDVKQQIIQDLLAWITAVFYGDQKQEEEETQASSEALQRAIDGGADADKALNSIFGKDRLKENAASAKPDKDLPLKGRFESRVIPTWQGHCN